MKTTIKTLILLLGILLVSPTIKAQDIGNNVVLRSFTRAVKSIEWRDFLMPQDVLDKPCYRRFLGQLNIIETTVVGRADLNLLLKDYKKMHEMAAEMANSNDPEIRRLFGGDARSAVLYLTNFGTGADADTFVSRVYDFFGGNDFDISNEGRQELEELFTAWQQFMSTPVIIDLSNQLLPCDRDMKFVLTPDRAETGFFRWEATMKIEMDCACPDPSSNTFVRTGEANIKTSLTLGINDSDFDSIKFGVGPNAKTPKLEILSLVCCAKGPADETDSTGDGQDDSGGNNDDQNDDDNNDDDQNDNNDDTGMNYDSFQDFKFENCCENVIGQHSIGFIPIVNLGNNFDDSTIGLGVEYTYNMGASFGNNQWRLGAGVLYANSSAQDGEITENFFEGNVFAENRTPIIPSVQWTQRVSVNYGLGTVDFFGNEEDISQFTFGINTGLNLDISDKVAIFGDASLLRFGNQTLEAANGMETDFDIGEFALGQGTWRIGCRVKFH